MSSESEDDGCHDVEDDGCHDVDDDSCHDDGCDHGDCDDGADDNVKGNGSHGDISEHRHDISDSQSISSVGRLIFIDYMCY